MSVTHCINGTFYCPETLQASDNAIGQTLASLCSLFAFIFAVLLLVLFNVKAYSITRVDRETLVKTRERVSASLYAILVIFYQIVLAYGNKLSGNPAEWPGFTFPSIFAWMVANFLGSLILLVAMLSSTRYRVLLYAPFPVQLCALLFILGETFARRQYHMEMIIPVILIGVSSVIVADIPSVFRMDTERLQYERSRDKRTPQFHLSSFRVEKTSLIRDSDTIVSKDT